MGLYPSLTVNGIALTDPLNRWALAPQQPLRTVPGLRATSVVVPGRSGVLWPAADALEASTFGVSLYVLGHGGTLDERVATLERNLEALAFVFSQAPLELSYQYSPSDVRTAHARLVSASTPVRVGTDAALWELVLELPEVFWRDSVERSYLASVASNTRHTIPFLSGGTGTVDDLDVVIGGPFSRVYLYGNRLEKNMTPGVYEPLGTYNNLLEFNHSISSSQSVYFDCSQQRAWIQPNQPSVSAPLKRAAEVTDSATASGRSSQFSWFKLWADSSGGSIVNPQDRRYHYGIEIIGGHATNKILVKGRRAFL